MAFTAPVATARVSHLTQLTCTKLALTEIKADLVAAGTTANDLTALGTKIQDEIDRIAATGA